MRLALALLALWPTFALQALATDPADADGAQRAPVALVTGSDRGLGLALTQELVMRGWRVVATCRDPARATVLQAFAAAHARVTLEHALVTYLQTLSPDKGGRLYSYSGQEVPW